MTKHLHLKPRLLALIIALFMGASGTANLFAQTISQGAVSGHAFTVNSSGSQVLFSQGNLQYIGSASTPYWKFAEHQWDYLGTTTGQNSSGQNVDRDLFGWGASGYNHGAVCYQPWSTSQTNSDYYAYGSDTYNLFDQTCQADWGYNAISNGGNTENSGWRTLTKNEWVYLFNNRSTTSGIRYAKANVNNVPGVILLPDDWSSSYYTLNSTNSYDASYASNSITASQWNTLEQYGAVFLPAAGSRNGTSVSAALSAAAGSYWSASYYGSGNAWNVYFYSDGLTHPNYSLTASNYSSRALGKSVRLVASPELFSFGINATPNPAEGGTVSGGGTFAGGAECTLTATPFAGYAFVNWTENGISVSTDASYTFTVYYERNLVANFAPLISQGSVGHAFKVNANGDQVLFSQGNLQYIGSASTPYWKFADNQWDYLGTTTGQNSSDENVDRDLFGWGTSGYNHGAVCYQPWSTSQTNSDYYAYGINTDNLYDQTGQADWGYNAISNGGNTEDCGWRTLTKDEWVYVFNTRTTASGKRYAKAKVNDVKGVILLPDDWSTSYYTLNSTNSTSADYTSNTITESQWRTLERHGAVFLPAAGYRYGTSFQEGNGEGNYWSAQKYSNTQAYFVSFGVNLGGGTLNPQDKYYSYYGRSVRLVASAQLFSLDINATPYPTEGGTVSGGGTYAWGTDCTLSATPSAGYSFFNWIEDGAVVSTDATYTFTVRNERNLIANFVQEGNIAFADANVKALCVANWDSNNDGELSYFEAANVTSLGNVFKNNTNIHSFNELQYFVTLGSIGEQAFYGCTSLTQITIPINIQIIGEKAFWNCPALETVTFNAVNCISMQTSYNSEIYSVFSSNNSGAPSELKRVNIGNKVTRIPNYAFKDSEDIYQRLAIPVSVTEIGNYAFYGCNSITQMVIQGNGLQIIGNHAFHGCSTLRTALNLPNSVRTVGKNAFYGCLQLPSLTIGESVTNIGDYAFWNCPVLTTVHFNATKCAQMYTRKGDGTTSSPYVYYSVFFSDTTLTNNVTPIVTLTIGDNVTTIPDYAFQNSTNLTSVITIPNATTYIGQYAFYGAHSPELTIGEGVTSVGGYAFWNCPDLATVHFNATNCTSMNTNSAYSVFNSGTSVGNRPSIVTLTIGSNVTKIPDYAFTYCQYAVGNLLLPDGLTYIGQDAFSHCWGFSGNLVIPNTVATLGQSAFESCVGFNGTLSLPANESLTTIEQFTFDGCTHLSGTLTIPDNVTVVSLKAFCNCSSFTGALVLHDAMTSIGQSAFSGCSNLSELTIGTGVTDIGGYAFWNCPNMATVHFNATNCSTMVTNSQYSVFHSGVNNADPTPIVTLTIGSNVTRIPAYAFRNSTNMTSVITIPNATKTIGTYAFFGAKSTELTIGTGVTSIGGYAFWDCPNLATVHFNAINCTQMYTRTGTSTSNYEYWSVFNSGTVNNSITSIVTLTIGSNVTKIPDYAFRNSINMTSVITIPNATKTIGTYAFFGAKSTELTIGTGVTSIGGYAFWDCPNLATVHFNAINCTQMYTRTGTSTSNYEYWSVFNSGTSNGGATPIVTLTIGENVTKIPNYSFMGSSNAIGKLLLPNELTFIGTYAFYQSGGLTGDLVIPNAVTNLGAYAFANCSGFDGSLIIGSGIENIQENTFNNCSGFSGSLIIGNQVNTIGDSAFSNCSGFSVLITDNPTPPTAESNTFDNMNFTIPVHVPDGQTSAYQSAAGWSQFNIYHEHYVFEMLWDGDNWSDMSNWYTGALPSSTDVVMINSDCHMDVDANVLHIYTYNINNTLTINSGKTLSTTYGVGTLAPSQLIIAEGGQLVNTISNASGTVQKQITGYGTGDDGWYTIAAPIYGGMPVNTLTTGNYDLYAYDEPTSTWLNQKVDGNFDELNPAQGYLYANQSPKTVNLAGQLNASNAEISIPVTYTAGELAGFNLVGNPYTNNISIGDVKINGTAQTAFYRAEGGSNLLAYVAADNEPIKPGDGFFVKATEEGTLTFGSAQTRGESQQDGYVRLVLRKNGSSTGSETMVVDRAYLRMNEGERLEKMSTSTAHSLLYFENGGSRYAVANNEAVNGVMPLFLEKANGTYSIETTLLNAECGYLHLVDNMTGKDIDLLETPVYSFEAKTTDYASRFNLVFSSEGDGPSTGSGTFAFIDADGNIIINGPSTGSSTGSEYHSGTSILQVFDVLGRQVFAEELSTVNYQLSTVNYLPGVYVLRLINGDSVRTQKIVIK